MFLKGKLGMDEQVECKKTQGCIHPLGGGATSSKLPVRKMHGKNNKWSDKYLFQVKPQGYLHYRK